MSQRGLQIRLLGELEVERDGRLQALPPSRKSRALLGYLVAAGSAQTRSRLCELFWEGPVDPRGELRWSLSKLRPLLDEPRAQRLDADREHVAFAPRGARLDLSELRAVVAGGVERAAPEDLRRAAALFRGEFLEGLDLPDCYRFHEWLTAEREATRALRLGILAGLVRRLEGAPQEALRYAREWVATDPLDEAAHAAVVHLLGVMGRGREAERQVESCLRILRQELGVARSEVLEAARAAIRVPSVASESAASRPPAAVGPDGGRGPGPEPAAPANGIPAIVGRAVERRRLTESLAAAAAGAARTLLVTGEAGIGKSRLLAELAGEASRRGGLVLQGRGFEAERGRPYGPWSDALRSAGSEEVARLAAPWRDDLAPLLPELGAAAGATDRNRLFDAVARLLADVGKARGLAVVALDDLHWLDESSLALVHYAARALSGSRVLLAAAARPTELERSAAAALVRGLEHEGRLERLDLGPLGPEETATLAHGVDPRLDGRQVFTESGGNPLFALEIARALARGDDALPQALADLIGDRLAHVGPSGLALLPWAAALGKSFDADRLSRVAGLAVSEVLAGLAELELQRVLRPAGEGEALHDFAHDLVRRAAYQQLSPPRRRLIHRRIAEALQNLPDPEDALAGAVAHHAALGDDGALAAAACIRAGERALRLLALAEAAELAERGLQHLSRLPRTTALPLAIGLLKVYVHATLGRRRNRELVADLTRLVDEARTAGLHAQVQTGLYLLSVLSEEEGRPADAEQHTLRAVQEARRADPATAVRALANTGRCLAQLEREPERAEALLLEARSLAERIGLEVIDIPWGLGLVRHHAGEEEEAVVELERALAIARREQDHWSQSQCLTRLAMIDLEGGRAASAMERCGKLRPLAAKLGEGSEGPVAAALEALTLVREGGVAAADRLDEALAAVRAVDTKGFLAYVLTAAGEHDLACGQLTAAGERAREALEAATAVGRRSQIALARALLARAAAAGGDQEAAARHIAPVRDDFQGPHRLSSRAAAAVGRVAASLGLPLSTTASTPAP